MDANMVANGIGGRLRCLSPSNAVGHCQPVAGLPTGPTDTTMLMWAGAHREKAHVHATGPPHSYASRAHSQGVRPCDVHETQSRPMYLPPLPRALHVRPCGVLALFAQRDDAAVLPITTTTMKDTTYPYPLPRALHVGPWGRAACMILYLHSGNGTSTSPTSTRGTTHLQPLPRALRRPAVQQAVQAARPQQRGVYQVGPAR